MATDKTCPKPPRPSARGIALLPFVGALSFPSAAWASPPPAAGPDPSSVEECDATLFPVPDRLQPSVRFWRELFTRHGSDRVVLHDRERLDVVWRVIELPKREDGAVDERLADRVVKAAVDDVSDRLRRLESDPTPIDEDDRVLLALAGEDPERLRGAWKRVRAQTGVADQFTLGLTRAQQWLDQVREILADEGVPTELAALPFIESMFNPMARSSAGAAGIWQLLPATAREHGLRVVRGHDERLDVLRSTRAAARMLRGNFRMLGSWPLAITGYNFGPYGLKRACSEIGSTDLMTLIDQYEGATFGFAPKNFYAEFLAALSVLTESSVDVDASSVRD